MVKASTGAKVGGGTVQQALARSVLYRLLSQALAYPDESTLAALRGELLLQAAAGAARYLPQAAVHLEAMARRLEGLAADLQAEHRRIFAHTFAADCPTYETAYGARNVFQQAQTMSDIAGFYRAFGLNVGGSQRERVDNVSVELEFMHFLTYKEAYARTHHGADEARLCRRAQRRFWEDHLGRWLSAFARRLEAKGNAGFYQPVALLASALAAAETRLLRVQPRAVEAVPAADASLLAGSCPWEGEGCLGDGGAS